MFSQARRRASSGVINATSRSSILRTTSLESPKQLLVSRTFVSGTTSVRGSVSKQSVLLAASATAITAYGLLASNKPAHAETKAVPLVGIPGTINERTFIAVKPDGVQRGLVGEIIRRFEARGYKLVAIKMIQPTQSFAEKHYKDLAKKPFFPGLTKYFSSGPVVAMVWEGQNVCAGGRLLVGATNPNDSLPGSIRGDLCVDIGRNIIHGSDGTESAKDEISLWFKDSEVANWTQQNHPWIY